MISENRLLAFEIILLGMFAFVLPSLETPKIIFWAMYTLTFLIRRYREHGFTFNKPDVVTVSVLSLFLVSLLSTFLNWPLDKKFSGSFDTLSYCVLFLCLYHGGYTEKQLKTITLVIISGALAGLLFGLSEYTSGITSSLGFHSAGVTTQSSIYLGIVIIAALGLQTDETPSPMSVPFLNISLFLMGVALLYMGSRGAIFAVLICILPLLLLNRSRRFLLTSLILIAAVASTSLFLINKYPTNKNMPEHRERLSIERFKKSDNERLENWQIAFKKISTGDNLLWGIGPKNYKTINPHDLGIESVFYQRTGQMHHAHNLFLTQWVEQGLVGLLALLGFFLLVFLRLIKSWRECAESNKKWIWASGLGALVVPVTAGFFNTPFYQEHAMLAMILMGSLFSATKSPA